jgi:hypothetical protein
MQEGNNIVWKINFKSSAMLDPYIFISEMEKLNINIIKIKKVDTFNWLYKLDFSEADISHTIAINNNEELKLQKPHKPYILEIKDAKEIYIKSKYLNDWYPKVTFYDNNLETLEIFKRNNKYKSIRIKIPKNTKYILIDDIYTILNIRRGLAIIVR